MILLLDLSAVFDTVDHNILLSRLKSRFRINGIALDWFRSYLSNRTYTVTVSGGRSTDRVVITHWRSILKFSINHAGFFGKCLVAYDYFLFRREAIFKMFSCY